MTVAHLINLDEARRFLAALDPAGTFSFASFDDDKTRSLGFLNRRYSGSLDVFAERLRELSQAGAAICVTINETDGSGHTKDHIQRIRAVFVDLDGAPLEPVMASAIKPHLVVQTSPGRWHAYWLVCDADLAEFSSIQRRLAEKFDADPSICALSQVMRLPGFPHQKADPCAVQLIHVADNLEPVVWSSLKEVLLCEGDLPASLPKTATASVPAENSVDAGGRNVTLTKIAGALRSRGMDANAVLETLQRINLERCHPPLPGSEIALIVSSIAKYPVGSSESSGIAISDTGNAERFVAQHGNDVRYVSERGKWLTWREGCWQVDTAGSIIERAKATAKSLFLSAAECESDSARAALSKHAVQSLNQARLKAMISLACTAPEIAVDAARLDADNYLLGVRNGVVDLRTGQFREARRADLLTQRCGTHFDAAADCPTFRSFLARVTGNDESLQEYLQRLVGYTLSGSTGEQCFAFLYGYGANGKSTFLDLIMTMLGDYATQTQPETLMAARRGSGASSDLARLVGKRLVVSNEVREGAHLEENLVKQLVGGDKVTARFLYQEHFEFHPRFKLIIAGNHMPVIKGEDEGIWRRVHFVPFTHTIPEKERDKRLGEKLLLELPGVLNWAIKGFADWQTQGLNPPPVITEATKAYRKEMDLFGTWLEQECRLGTGLRISSRRLYENYREWCERGGIKPASSMIFLRKLEPRGLRREHTRTGNIIVGIDLKGLEWPMAA